MNREDTTMTRSFEDKPAIRSHVPLLIGLMGPSGGGKTFSALRLATGIQKMTGGDIFMIDTEARRGLHYADRFKFRHLEFSAPFGPLDYLAAIDHCAKKGAKTIIVDSMSHEHEGPGGVLEMHESELQRLSKGNEGKRDALNFLAWAKPKAERRRMINTILQLPCNFIFCFRAKEKLKIERGKSPEARGFMPIAGEEFVYEMALNCLLLPNAGGIPTWNTKQTGEKMMIKLPQQFHSLLAAPMPLSEDIGSSLATWSSGAALPDSPFAKFAARIASASSVDELDALLPELQEIPKNKSLPPAEYKALRDIFGDRGKALIADSEPEDDGPQSE
jgi:energy-coupling factor transporter ATP-binding protein EcfA2